MMKALLPDRFSVPLLLYGILFLLFFQLISDFVEAIYAFGLLGTSIPPELVFVLLLLTPLLLLLVKSSIPDGLLLAVGLLLLASRSVEVILPTRGRMLVAGVGVGSFLLLFPLLLWRAANKGNNSAAATMGAGLSIAVVLSVFLRAAGSGLDISTDGRFQVIGWSLAVVAALLLFAEFGGRPARQMTNRDEQRAATGRIAGMCLGITTVFILLYFVFTSPNVIARWTGGNYPLIVGLLVFILPLFILLWTIRPRLLAALSPAMILVWNILFVLSLVLTILPHQIRFVADAGAYPLVEPTTTGFHYLPLFSMLLLFPVILVDFTILTRALIKVKPAVRSLGVGFTLGALFFLALILSHIFTTVYDYIPAIGPFFRDQFWLVHLVAGLALLLSMRLVEDRHLEAVDIPAVVPGGMLALGALTLALVLLIRPNTGPNTAAHSGGETVKILTYNIQQGYSAAGLKNFDGQLDLMRQVDADIIGLQESDTNRIANGNSDGVRYFADRLELYAYYGPKVVPGTFGIALLSKYPIENPQTYYMYSQGEQAALIAAQITINDQTYNVFVTHLGNGGPIIQQENVLEVVGGKANVILMGDFNFRPASEQYHLTTGKLADSWLLRRPDGADQGVDPPDRIDHIFVSPGTAVKDSAYLTDPQSDHPAMVTEIEQ